jgi:hypothetical protein
MEQKPANMPNHVFILQTLCAICSQSRLIKLRRKCLKFLQPLHSNYSQKKTIKRMKGKKFNSNNITVPRHQQSCHSHVIILNIVTVLQIQWFMVSVICPNIFYLQGTGHFFDITYVSWIETVTCLKIFKRFLNLPFVSQNKALKDKMIECNSSRWYKILVFYSQKQNKISLKWNNYQKYIYKRKT